MRTLNNQIQHKREKLEVSSPLISNRHGVDLGKRALQADVTTIRSSGAGFQKQDCATSPGNAHFLSTFQLTKVQLITRLSLVTPLDNTRQTWLSLPPRPMFYQESQEWQGSVLHTVPLYPRGIVTTPRVCSPSFISALTWIGLRSTTVMISPLENDRLSRDPERQQLPRENEKKKRTKNS